MVDVTASLDAATQQVLALLAQIRLSNVRAVQAQDIGAADAYAFAPIPSVTSYGADLVLVADIATPNLTTTPKLTIQGLGTVPIQAADGSAPAVGTVAGKRLIGFSTIAGGGFAARLLGLAPADISALLAAYIANNFIISTAVTKTIGTDFPTLAAAFAWVGQYRVTPNGSVQFVLPAGQTKITGQILGINHPDGARISIVGAPMTLAAPTAANFQVTGFSAAARANDRAANLAMCRARYGSELLLLAGAEIVVTSSFGGLLNLLVSSDGTSNPAAGLLGDVFAVQSGLVYATNCVFAGAAARGVVSTGSATTILGSCFAFGNGGHGFSAEQGGKIFGTTAAGSFGNGGNGAFSSNGGLFSMDQTVANSNLNAQGNAQNGASATYNGVISTVGPAAVLNDNALYGASTLGRASIIADGANSANNGLGSFTANAGGYISAINTTGGGNGSYGYNANGGSLIVATGGSATGGSGSMTPAANTVGNGDAYIYQ